MKAIDLVGNFVSLLTYEEIPPSVLLEAKRAMVDCIGVSLAASREPCLEILRSFIQKMGGEPSSTLFGTKISTSPAWAALYNGTMAHALDYDDGAGLELPLHPSAPVLPAVIALGESVGANGKSVLEAYIGGVEVECKLAKGCSRQSYDLGWHATGVFGTMGAAAASAKLLGLNAPQIKTALGIALSLAAGSKQNFGTMVKPLHAGMAAMHGVMSSMLAQGGFTASEEALDGPFGFSRLFSGSNLIGSCDSLGNPFHLAAGLSIKKYPSCYSTHTALDAMFDLLKRHRIHYRKIKRIDCFLSPHHLPGLPYKQPQTPLEGKFSLEFVLAVACVYGKVDLSHFSDEVLRDDNIIDLEKKVHVQADNQLLHLTCRVAIELMNGLRYSTEVEIPRGHPRYPLSLDEIKEKFKSCATRLLQEKEIEILWHRIMHLEELRDIRAVTELIKADNRRSHDLP